MSATPHTRSPARTNIKESSAVSLRRSMTQRRHNLSAKIRKSKKSSQIQLKRRSTDGNGTGTGIGNGASSSSTTASALASSSSSSSSPQECLQYFIASPSPFTLSALQASLASSKQNSSLPLHEIPSPQAEQFINLLATSLTATSANNEEQEQEHESSVLHTLQILTNLAAMECPEAYYTSSSSWCSFILSSASNIPSALLNLLSSLSSSLSLSSSKAATERVLEQVCWVIGNIAGDSQQCRDQLISLNFIPSLVQLSRQVQVKISVPSTSASSTGASSAANVIANPDPNTAIGLRRNIYWALSNMARGNNTALPFLQGGLSCTDILHTLRMDMASLEHNSNRRSCSNNMNEWDVRKELYWLLAFLTTKEDEVIDHLINEDVLHLLSRQFDYVTTIILEQRDRGSIFQSVIPLIRILGNLATTAGGKHVPGIIAVNGNAINKTLARWLQVCKPCGETITIANEATWVIGALLCDVGYPDHPSTKIACPILLPALCNVLLIGTFTLEWKREVLNSIWNALAAPPGSHGDDTLQTRDELLLSIYKTKGMVRALVGLCTCMDVDAIRPAVNMIDAFHRRMGRRDENVARVLQEAECLHALEHICDAASSSSSSYSRGTDWSHANAGHSGGMDYCAEMAANLIDDFYGDEEIDWEVGGSRSSTEFEFGVQGPTPTFNFGGGDQDMSNSYDSVEGRRNPNPTTTLSQQAAGRGRGRGRGRVVPAWMQNMHQ